MSGCYGEIRGFLFRDPEAKTAKSGADYTVANIKVRDGDANVFWRAMAFKDKAGELLGFKDGDGVSIKGFVKCEIWTPEGKEPRISLSLMAQEIAPWAPGKASTQGERKPYTRPIAAQAANGGGKAFPPRHDQALNDDVPW